MKLFDKANEASEFIKSKISSVPDTAVVLGSGLGSLADEIEAECLIEYENIPHFASSTVEGHAGRLIYGTLEGKKIIAMQGRFHFYEGKSAEEIMLPVRAFQLLGVKNYIVTNASGAVNLDYKPGDLMLITDHIGLFCPSVLWGENDERFGTRFPSMGEAYDKELIALAEDAAKSCSLTVHKGVYCYCRGPMFETPAEIRMIRGLGADAVGMSTVPEVVTAVHGGMKVLGISCITNMAAGILDEPLSQKEVIETGRKIEKEFSKYIKTLVSNI